MNKKTSAGSAVQFVDIEESQAGQRLDNFLLKTLKGLPRSRLYRIIRKGEVRVNKKRVKPEYKLCPGDILRIPPVNLKTDKTTPLVLSDDLKQKMETALLFENNNLLILNKPSGLAVHAGSGLRFGIIDIMRSIRPDETIELVHRLDRDTSGCLILSKNRATLLNLQGLMQANEIQKKYVAIVKGYWERSLDRINLPLKPQIMSNGEKRVYVDENGQSAQTRIDDIQLYRLGAIKMSMIKLRLLTGRTHQIRVHCQSQGHEIAGDNKYGDKSFNQSIKKMGVKRLLLHANELEIPRSAHNKALKISAPLPKAFSDLITEANEV